MNNQKHDIFEVKISEFLIIKFSTYIIIVSSIAFITLFLIWYTYVDLMSKFRKFLSHLILWIIPVIILHEGLHGLFWAVFKKYGFKSIQFGFHKQYLTFYTHCQVPLKKWVFFLGGIAPLIFLGCIPILVSLLIGNSYWLFLGLLNFWASAADLLVCIKIIKLPSRSKILDHPNQLGFFVFVDNSIKTNFDVE